jgi:hypothetical protein
VVSAARKCCGHGRVFDAAHSVDDVVGECRVRKRCERRRGGIGLDPTDSDVSGDDSWRVGEVGRDGWDTATDGPRDKTSGGVDGSMWAAASVRFES